MGTDGIANGAGNVIKKIQLVERSNPSAIIWVLPDHADDVGQKPDMHIQLVALSKYGCLLNLSQYNLQKTQNSTSDKKALSTDLLFPKKK